MLGHQKPKNSMFQMVSVEELVPQDHFLRQLDAVVDFSFIRDRVRPLYCEDNGRPSVDPELALRMFILSYLYNISENRLCDEIAMHAGYRWFCRLDFHDPVPDRTTLVKLRKRWGTNDVFADVMLHVVKACVEAGLVSGEILAVDGTLVKARAATRSLETIDPPVALEEYLNTLAASDATTDGKVEPPNDNEPPSDEPPPTNSPGASERKAGDPNFRGEKFSNATHRSKTDPDARLYSKGPHQEAELRFMVHNVMDAKSCVILEAKASQCSGDAERQAALTMLESVRRLGLDLQFLLGDGGYTAGWFLRDLMALGIEPLVPIKGEIEPLPTWQRRTFNLDHMRKRKVRVEVAAARNRARMMRESPTYRATYSLRTRMEHRFAEGKEWHGLDRARGYGLVAMDIQAKLTATVQNLKRLVRWKRRRPKAGVAIMSATVEARIERTTATATAAHLSHFASLLRRFVPVVSKCLLPSFST